jgi:hypothetical protein
MRKFSVNGIVVAPHHIRQGATYNTRFDVMAIQSQITLNIESIGAAGHWSMGIDLAVVGGLIQ